MLSGIAKTRSLLLMGVVIGGCSTGPTDSGEAGAGTLKPGLKAQFQCADRNGNEYIDQAELAYLPSCAMGEDLICDQTPDAAETQPDDGAWQTGRKILNVVDADGDDRISRLEFRAHCTNEGQP